MVMVKKLERTLAQQRIYLEVNEGDTVQGLSPVLNRWLERMRNRDFFMGSGDVWYLRTR